MTKITETQRLIGRFLEHLEIVKNQSPKTIENYHHYLSRFSEFIGPKTPGKLTLDDIHSYQLHLNRITDDHKHTLGKKTQNYHLVALRAFFKYLSKNDIPTLAPEKIDLKKTSQRSVDFLTREEVERLFEAVDLTKKTGFRDRTILETLYSTGLRVSELCSLNRDQVDLERKEFTVRGKGDKARVVFLSDRCVNWINKYTAERTDNWSPLFISFGRSREGEELTIGEKRRLTPYTIQTIVRDLARFAGLGKKVTPHVLRHSFATELLYNGADIRAVQEMLGHASITTTQVYTHSTNTRLREIHEKFHR